MATEAATEIEPARFERENSVSSGLQERRRRGIGEGLVLVLFVGLSLSYVVLLPSFEGPDESEHARYVRAWAEGAEVHPLDPDDLLRWGYQVHHPPLYYALAGGLARLLGLTFHESLVINREQNPHFPFLRHDLAAQSFPYDPVHRSLRLLRLFSVGLGLLTFFVLRYGFDMLFPDEPATRALLLAGSLLAPNTLQIFGTVANDALNMLFCATTLVLAIAIVRQPAPGAGVFLLAGASAALAAITKLTGLAALAVAGSIWAVDAVVNRRVHGYLRGMAAFLPVFLVVAGPVFAANLAWYGDLTRESLLEELTPAFHLEPGRSLGEILWVLSALPRLFAADLGWQSVRLPGLGCLLFVPWLLAVIASAALAWRSERGRIPTERLIPLLAVLWGVVLLGLANREWTNLQFRHVWCLYPFTLIGVVHVLQLLPEGVREWGGGALAVGLLGLLLVNAQVFARFREFHEPHYGLGMNRDYYTYLYMHVKDPLRAHRYLESGR